MLDLPPPTGLVMPPPPVDHAATGLARSFVQAIVGGDFDRLETLFAPHVRFRAITPSRYLDVSTAAGARALVEGWFGESSQRELVGWTVEPVGDRLALGYRLELTEDDERRVVEQHVAAIVDGAAFRDVALVCSGFRPLSVALGGATGTGAADASGDDIRAEAPAMTSAARLDATGLSCATLTPTISATVRGLEVGAILEIVTDDPEAEEGLRSWTRLTGNEIVATEVGPGSARRFGIRRSPRDAAPSTRKGAH